VPAQAATKSGRGIHHRLQGKRGLCLIPTAAQASEFSRAAGPLSMSTDSTCSFLRGPFLIPPFWYQQGRQATNRIRYLALSKSYISVHKYEPVPLRNRSTFIWAAPRKGVRRPWPGSASVFGNARHNTCYVLQGMLICGRKLTGPITAKRTKNGDTRIIARPRSAAVDRSVSYVSYSRARHPSY